PRPLGPLATARATAATTTAATSATATATTTTAAATAAPACCSTMASLTVLAFDHEGRPVQFDTWLDDLQLYLLSDSKDSVSLFDIASGAAPAPPAIADSATRSQWLTRDAAARLAIRNHLPLAECAHFGQHRTAQALYAAVVARYSSPATAALGRLLLPYLFPKLSAFAIVEDLPPMFITLYFIVTRLLDSLRSVRDHFLSLDPTSLTVDLLEQHLLAAETSAVAVGAARGTPRPPFFEGCSPSPLAPSYASAAAADVSVAEDVGAAAASATWMVEVAAVVVEVAVGVVVGAAVEVAEAVEVVAAVGLVAGVGALLAAVEAAVGVAAVEVVGLEVVGLDLRMEALVVASDSSSSVGARPSRPSSSTCGKPHTQHRCFSRLDDAWRAEFGDNGDLPRWADLLRSRIAIFDLDFDAILSAMYALSVSAEGDRYRCVPPNLGISATTLGASESGTLPGTAPAEALHTFTLDSGTSRSFFRDNTTLTPLPAPVPVRLAHPSGGPVVARSSTILPCLDAMVTTTTPGGQRVSIYTCTRTGRHLATFTCRPGSSLYTLATDPPQVAASAQVSPSPAALACLALPSLRRGAAARRSSLLLVSPDVCSSTDSPHGLRLQLREQFGQDLPVLRLHSDRGVRYAAHQLNLWSRVSLPETSPTMQKRHTCTDLGELRSYLGLQITRDRARRTIPLTQSHMVHQVLQRFSFQFSSPQPTPLSTSHSLSAPPLDESVEPSGLYPELVGCLMYVMTRTRPDLAYPLNLLARYVAPVLGGRGPVVLTGHADASWVDDSATQRTSQGYIFSLGSGSVSWRSTHSSSVLSSSCEAEIYTRAMAAHELRWLTYLLTDFGDQPRSPPVLYVDNKAMISLCQGHRLEHRTKHIAMQYFLARELQQRGQLRLAYVATRASTADIFTMALPPGDHQRFSTVLGLVPSLPHLLTA
ncbi:unnamed protein product, partial [Closterium sp. NIES-54]